MQRASHSSNTSITVSGRWDRPRTPTKKSLSEKNKAKTDRLLETTKELVIGTNTEHCSMCVSTQLSLAFSSATFTCRNLGGHEPSQHPHNTSSQHILTTHPCPFLFPQGASIFIWWLTNWLTSQSNKCKKCPKRRRRRRRNKRNRQWTHNNNQRRFSISCFLTTPVSLTFRRPL